jgi:hypothetical protein
VRSHRFIRPRFPPYDPAIHNLGLWVRGSYTASPWTGVASAGTSSTNNLSEATNPPTVGESAQYSAALFDGTNDLLTGDALSDFFTTANLSIGLMFKVAAVAADNALNSGELVSDSGGVMSIGTFMSGAQAQASFHLNTAGGWITRSWDISLNEWQIAYVSYDSASGRVGLYHSDLSGVVPTSLTTHWGTTGAITSIAGTLRVGASKAAVARFFNGQIMEIMASPSTSPLDSFGDNFKSYMLDRYGL